VEGLGHEGRGYGRLLTEHSGSLRSWERVERLLPDSCRLRYRRLVARILLILLIVWVVLAVLGVAVKGLVWLFWIAVILFVATLIGYFFSRRSGA
jgi:fatty acid desaturase